MSSLDESADAKADAGAAADHRLGINLGGTKIAGTLIDRSGRILAEQRIATPRNDYAGTISAIAGVARTLRTTAGVVRASIGIGIPGSISPASGRVQNANSTWLNGRRLQADLSVALGQPVRIANDANCFALSEATDGAGAHASIVLGVILGTGCGSGIVHAGRPINGPRGIGGEWGHNPLPWPTPAELPGPLCWCGRHGCMEAWVSGPGLAADHTSMTGDKHTAEDIAQLAEEGDAVARATLERHASRLARGLAHVVNILDPDVVVLGGGLSRLGHLYAVLPSLMAPHIFADHAALDIRPPRWGDASGVRGAAWLWD